MNSASRLLKLVNDYISYSQEKNNKPLEKNYEMFYKNKYNVDTSNQIIYLNTQILVIKEIFSLKNKLKKINKYEKNERLILDLETLFSHKLPTHSLLPFKDNLLVSIEDKLEIIEDLLEARGFKEEEIKNDDMNSIFKTISSLIKKLEKIAKDNDDLSNYIVFIKTIEESLRYYKLTGATTLENALEKLICRSKLINEIFNDDVKKDINLIIGSLFTIYNTIIKYPNKAIEYAKKQHIEQIENN